MMRAHAFSGDAGGSCTFDADQSRVAFVLGGLGGLSLLAYVAVNFLLPTAPRVLSSEPAAILIDRLPFWSAMAGLPLLRSDAQVIAIEVVAAVLVPACYLLALVTARRIPSPPARLMGLVVGLGVLFWLTSVVAPPDASDRDVYMYIAHERVWNLHGANPYLVAPAVFEDDPILRVADPLWVPFGTPYGPTWTVLSIVVGHVTGDDLVGELLAFRAVLFGCGLASLVLIWAILGRLSPDYRFVGLTLYAWNPIVVLKGQGHIESLMVCLLLLGAYWWVTGRHFLALLVLALSVGTKYVTAPLLLSAVASRWPTGSTRSLVRAGVVCGVLAIVAVIALWNSWATARPILTMVIGTAQHFLPAGKRALFLPGFVVVLVWAIWTGREAESGMLPGWAALMIWFSLFLAPRELSYYLITLVAVASLVDSSVVVVVTVALCTAAWLQHVLFGAWPPYAMPWHPSSWLLRLGLPAVALLWVQRGTLERLAEQLIGWRVTMRSPNS